MKSIVAGELLAAGTAVAVSGVCPTRAGDPRLLSWMLRIPDASLTQIGLILFNCNITVAGVWWSHAVLGVDHPVGLTPSACGRSLIVFGRLPAAMVTYRETNFLPKTFPVQPILLCDGAHIGERAGRRGDLGEKSWSSPGICTRSCHENASSSGHWSPNRGLREGLWRKMSEVPTLCSGSSDNFNGHSDTPCTRTRIAGPHQPPPTRKQPPSM